MALGITTGLAGRGVVVVVVVVVVVAVGVTGAVVVVGAAVTSGTGRHPKVHNPVTNEVCGAKPSCVRKLGPPPWFCMVPCWAACWPCCWPAGTNIGGRLGGTATCAPCK